MDFKSLAEPFLPADVEWRIGRSGVKNDKVWALALAYVTNRAIMARLDSVCSPWNWKNEFAKGPTGGVICGISIRCGDEWVAKWDGADTTGIEATKGGLSGAMKRAAVQWGIGRYLYNLPESFVKTGDYNQYANKANFKNKKTGKVIYYSWQTPLIPKEFLPEGVEQTTPQEQVSVEPEEEDVTLISENQLITLHEICESKNWNVNAALKRLAKKYDLKKINHLPEARFKEVSEYINGFAPMERRKE